MTGRVGERRRHGMPAIKNDAALLGADTLPAKIPAGGPPALVPTPPESVLPRVLHRPCSEISDKDIAAPIARSALSAKSVEGWCKSDGRGARSRSRGGKAGETRNPARRLTLRASAMINSRHGIPVFTGNDRASRHSEACSPGRRVRDVRESVPSGKGGGL
jgi:hypothetical protein